MLKDQEPRGEGFQRQHGLRIKYQGVLVHGLKPLHELLKTVYTKMPGVEVEIIEPPRFIELSREQLEAICPPNARLELGLSTGIRPEGERVFLRPAFFDIPTGDFQNSAERMIRQAENLLGLGGSSDE